MKKTQQCVYAPFYIPCVGPCQWERCDSNVSWTRQQWDDHRLSFHCCAARIHPSNQYFDLVVKRRNWPAQWLARHRRHLANAWVCKYTSTIRVPDVHLLKRARSATGAPRCCRAGHFPGRQFCTILHATPFDHPSAYSFLLLLSHPCRNKFVEDRWAGRAAGVAHVDVLLQATSC
jgi:hypothetical protein